MKKTILTSIAFFIAIVLFAQAPNSFNYQAAVRDADGKILANKVVSFRISILETSANGTVAYMETHNTATSEHGLVNLSIGAGTVASGNFSTIDWGAKSHFIRTELDPAGGTNFTIMSTQQLLSVPYALSVANDKVDDADADPANEIQTISLTGSTVTLSKSGGSITIPSAGAQTISKSGSTVTLSDGGGSFTDAVDDADASATNEIQILSKAGNVISLSKSGGSVTLDASTSDEIVDADGDTKIVVEQTSDDDMIRFYQHGTEFFRMDSGRFAIFNPYLSMAIGQNTLEVDTGFNNIAIGAYAIRSNTNGGGNIGIGIGAVGDNTVGDDNYGLGHGALSSNVSGSYNVGIGKSSHEDLIDGYSNVALGHFTLTNNIHGSDNIAIGYGALSSDTLTDGQLAIGHSALRYNKSGTSNLAIGNYVMRFNNDGSDNTAVGDSSLLRNRDGMQNVALGKNSMIENQDGNNNVAIGAYASSLATGDNNTVIGSPAGEGQVAGDENTFVGYRAGWTANSTSSSYLGSYAGPSGSTGFTNSTGIGYSAITTANNQARIGNTVTSIGGPVAWTTVSDGQFKVNVKENVKGLDFIMDLRPVTYNLDVYKVAEFLKEDERFEDGVPQHMLDARASKFKTVQTGFIAQEVEASAKKLGYDFSGVDAPKNENDYYGLRYAEFVVPLVKGMQEQQATIIALEKKIAELTAIVQTLTTE